MTEEMNAFVPKEKGRASKTKIEFVVKEMGLYIYKYDIVFQEVPDHISLAFYVSGCPLRCPGCHSPELWKDKNGRLLTTDFYGSLLERYKGFADCVLFLGGEWHSEDLVTLLDQARDGGFETALYTGLEDVSENLKKSLTFLKTGDWREKLGGLSSSQTNQIFKDLRTNKILNHLFQQQS